jgi:protein-S-isoprenylcysteine O-methyltransferase Ste14
MTSSSDWNRIARRIRVPLGFVFAIVFLWLARPTWLSMLLGALITMVGLAIRASAAGHVRKNAELTTSGPYAYTRNPLYLGSLILAIGFAVASRSVWVALVIVLFLLAIYLPVIRSEEDYLRATFVGFEEYAKSVPRLLPRLSAWRSNGEAGSFSRELYRKHREYNALMGAIGMFAALAAKILWLQVRH